MNMMQLTVFGWIIRYSLKRNVTPDPIKMLFIAKAHTHEEITQGVMNKEDEDGESQLLQKI